MEDENAQTRGSADAEGVHIFRTVSDSQEMRDVRASQPTVDSTVRHGPRLGCIVLVVECVDRLAGSKGTGALFETNAFVALSAHEHFPPGSGNSDCDGSALAKKKNVVKAQHAPPRSRSTDWNPCAGACF